MSKHFESIEGLPEPEPLDFEFDPIVDIRESYDRLCEEVQFGHLTEQEANEIYNLMREQYGL